MASPTAWRRPISSLRSSTGANMATTRATGAASPPSIPAWRALIVPAAGLLVAGRLRLLVGGLVGLVAVRGGGIRRPSLPLAVVGGVEARPLEVHGDRMEHPLHRRVAGLADG